MSKNYIVINGKKAELTEEQLKQLGIEIERKTAFTRQEKKGKYYYITSNGTVRAFSEDYMATDDALYGNANYCTDEKLMHQRALHETLNRLLWRFACENGELENEWNGKNDHWYVVTTHGSSASFSFTTSHTWSYKPDGVVCFPSYDLAKKAIDTIIMPFMEKHPEFVW